VRLVLVSARWVPVGVLLVAISLQAGSAGLTFVPGAANDLLVRKIGHAAVYGLLAVLVRWALMPLHGGAEVPGVSPGHGTGQRWATLLGDWLLPLLIATLVAFADELRQAGSPGREPKLTDVATDLTGAIAALVLLRSVRLRRGSRGAGRRSPPPSSDEATARAEPRVVDGGI